MALGVGHAIASNHSLGVGLHDPLFSTVAVFTVFKSVLHNRRTRVFVFNVMPIVKVSF